MKLDKNSLSDVFRAYTTVSQHLHGNVKEMAKVVDNEIVDSLTSDDLKKFEKLYTSMLSKQKVTLKGGKKQKKKQDPREQKGVHAITYISPILQDFFGYFDDFPVINEDGQPDKRKRLGSELKYVKKGYVMRSAINRIFQAFLNDQLKELGTNKITITDDMNKYFNEKGENPFYIYHKEDPDDKNYVKYSIDEAIKLKLANKNTSTLQSLIDAGKIKEDEELNRLSSSQSISSANYKTLNDLKNEGEDKIIKEMEKESTKDGTYADYEIISRFCDYHKNKK